MNVKYLKPLPIEQEITVEEMYQHHSNRRYRQRAHMILLSAQGYSQIEIAKIVRVMPKTVAKFIERYKKHGFLGLYDEPIPGRPPKITEDIQRYIDEYLQASPRDHGYNMSGWTISLMRYDLWSRFGISVCIETVHRWFARIGYSLIFPRYRLLDANDKEVDEFGQEFIDLLFRAKQGEVILLFMDESNFRMVPTLSRIWAKKGSKPMIPTHNDKRKVVITGGTDPLTGKTYFRLSTRANKEAALAFLKQIRRHYPDAEIVVLLDSSRAHKSRIVKEYVSSDKKIHLVFLPKYSPKLNKQEDIWKWFRKRVSHNFLFDSPKALADAIRDGYRYLQRYPQRVLSLVGNM
jgi:transposase